MGARLLPFETYRDHFRSFFGAFENIPVVFLGGYFGGFKGALVIFVILKVLNGYFDLFEDFRGI